MSDSAPSSPSVVPSNLGVISASDMESHSESASLSDSDFEVVLVAQATAALAVSDTDSGSLVSVPTDFVESSDEEHIFVPNIAQSAPNTPRPPFVNPARSTGTPRPALSAIARPVIELGHESDASDREDDSSVDDSDSGSEDGSVLRARARPVTITNDRLEAPINSISTTITLHSNTSAATIRPVTSVHSSLARRAGMHTTPVTTNTIVGIVSFAPLSPITPSDGGEISYVPFTAAPSAVSVPVLDGVRRSMPVTRTISAPAVAATSIQPSSPRSTPPPVPGGIVGKKKWSHMNSTRLTLGFTPLKHILRLKQNCEVSQKAAEEKGTPRARAEAAARAKAQEEAIARVQMHKEASAKAHAEAQARKRAKAEANKKAQAEAKAKATVKSAAKVTGKKWKAKTEAKSLVAPPPTVGASPVTSEDEAPRMRASMFLPADHASIPNEGPEDEEAYDAAIKQLDEHMLSPPEHPTATYRHLLNQALLLEFRICTPETLPRSHGATIAMVKTNVHINILDYVAKRKEGFSGLRAAMLENAKALRKDVRKRRMPVTTVKSLGLQSLLVLH